MLVIVIPTGLACGMLLAASGLILWGGFKRMPPGLPYAVQIIRWLAGGLLLIGAVLAWPEEHSLFTPTLRLTLMAALAAPPEIHRRSHSSWDNLMPILPALILAGTSLFWTTEPIETGAGSLPVIMVELAIITCGGLGARALGHALSEITTSTLQVEWPSAAAYTLLTLLISSTAMVNLWQRGTIWGWTTGESRLAGAWLAWSAAWMGPRRPPRLRTVLIAVAASLLIILAIGY